MRFLDYISKLYALAKTTKEFTTWQVRVIHLG